MEDDTLTQSQAGGADGHALMNKELQSIAEQRKLRSGIVKLRHEMADEKEQLVQPDNAKLHVYFDRENAYFKQIQFPRELCNDIEAIGDITDMTVEQAKKFRKDHVSHFDLSTFVGKLRMQYTASRLGHEEVDTEDMDEEDRNAVDFDWNALGEKYSHLFCTAPTVNFISGSLDVQPKEKKARQRRQREDLGQAVKPTEIINTQQEEKSDTDKRIAALAQVLAKRSPVNYFELLVNPESFTQTVENIFDFAFLVKDGRAKVYVTPAPDSQPIAAVAAAPRVAQGQADKEKLQCVIQMDYNTWQSIVEIYNIREPAIPSRPRPVEEDPKSRRGMSKHAPAPSSSSSSSSSSSHSELPLSQSKASKQQNGHANSGRKRRRDTESNEEDEEVEELPISEEEEEEEEIGRASV
eukprot:GILK01006392.1.p1 GENE.GILK01006392.1~~GILK01006392.1.p1  ORF type:complete len:423 (+),score=99.93 GILK01006392.1:43-1269(+)